jgi:hypothetical protein
VRSNQAEVETDEVGACPLWHYASFVTEEKEKNLICDLTSIALIHLSHASFSHNTRQLSHG